MPDSPAALLPLDRLEPWLAAHIPGFRGPVTAEKTPVGQSNPTFVLTAPSGRYVLRRKPPGQLLKSAHAVDREFRVISALADSEVPVPRALALCEDEGVIGAMFYVMAHVPGRTFLDPRLPGLSPDARAAAYDDMNRCLAALHSVDVARAGLSDFGPPGSYFARQVARWAKQYRASQTEEIPEMDRVIAWLEANLPGDDDETTLVHGDWRIDNLRYAPDAPRVAAVLDWELSTLGHPLADLGYQLMQWRMPPGEPGRGLEGVDRAALGIPSDEAYVEAYARRRGLTELPDMTYCLAFAFFRMAAILQGVKKRALDGNASNPEAGLRLGSFVPEFARRAARVIESA
ncbi:MAG: phosphotransferase family protein [Alphaproteobacteria bacterium]|nr:MAG: phosphotransferase family protein [Alphaproteobacteria bacterium]